MLAPAVATSTSIGSAPWCFTLHFAQYNVLAANLCNNLKPWFWYGVKGCQPSPPAPYAYTGDAFDSKRVETFGYGRSKLFVDLWCIAKQYLKLYEPRYPYRIQDLANPPLSEPLLSPRQLYQQQRQQEQQEPSFFPFSTSSSPSTTAHTHTPRARRPSLDEGEKPALSLKHRLHDAIFDFFHRNATNHGGGNKDLAYHLFDRNSTDFRLVSKAWLEPLGYAPWTEEEWGEGERLKGEIWREEKEGKGRGGGETCTRTGAGEGGAGGEAAAGGEQTHTHTPPQAHTTKSIDNFNAWLRRLLVLKRRHTHHGGTLNHFILSQERVEEEFHEVALELATFLSLNEEDVRRVVGYQHEMEWGVRGGKVVEEIKRIGADIVGLEEVDRVEDMRTKLHHTHTHTQEEEKEGPSLELAVYKHRKTCPEDDGCALFYDPRVVRVYQLEGKGGGGGPAVACVRFSGEAEVKQQQQQQNTHNQGQEQVELPLYHSQLPINEGIVGCEEEAGSADTHTHTHKIDLWSFTSPQNLRRSHQELWDERVAVVALFEHITTGELILTACTHLAHSQDKPQAEAVRAAQVRQLDRALGEIERKWLGFGVGRGKEEVEGRNRQSVPRVVMMDGNDPPRLEDLGAHRCAGGGGASASSSSSFSPPSPPASPYTPFYHTTTQGLGYLDLLGEDYGPTSITLHRRLRLDYIFYKPPISKEEEGIKIANIDFLPALRVRLAGVNEKGQKVLLEEGEPEEERAVYGLPLPAIDGVQACVPSDHLHVSVKVTFGDKGEKT